MPAGFSVETGGPLFPAKLTGQVFVCSIIAACGGLMFGYDIGISAGITSMDDFLEKFFPVVYVRKHHVHENNYCKYDNVYLQLFTSSLYLAAILASFVASFLCKTFGRKRIIQLASIFFVSGAIVGTFSQNLIMLIVGRMLLGVGVGFGNQAVPLFISEIAPARYRGGLNVSFQLLVTVGILVANMVNYGTSHLHPYGWRVSLGGAAVPALILLFGSFAIVETPTSLIERHKKEEALRTLRRIRGVHDVDMEFEQIIQAVDFAKQSKSSFRSLLKRKSIPPLFCGTIFQVFQQFTGINVVMFYAPVLFQTIGFGSDASLLSSVIMGFVNVCSTLVANFGVDKFGRRFLLIEGALQMIIAQCIIGTFLKMHLTSTSTMPKNFSMAVVILICLFVSGFAWSWGPLGWLVPSEIFQLEARNAGFFFAVSMNMFCTFIIAQAFLSMLCRMRAYIFFFFALWLVVMCLFVIGWLPETKGVHIDEIEEKVWKKHWFWKRFFDHSVDVEEVKPKVEEENSSNK